MTQNRPTVSAPPLADSARASIARVGLLGLNAWLVAVLIPSLYVGAGEPLAVVLGALPLAALVAGLVAFDIRPASASLGLVVAFPPVIALAIAARPELVESDAYGPVGIALASASMLAFVAAAVDAARPQRTVRDTRTQRLTHKEPVVEPLMRRWMRRALLAIASGGAFVIAVIGPALGTRRERVAAWGEAADDAAALTAVVASVATAVALGAVVGPALRAARERREAPVGARRWIVAIAVAIAAGIGWLALHGFTLG